VFLDVMRRVDTKQQAIYRKEMSLDQSLKWNSGAPQKGWVEIECYDSGKFGSVSCEFCGASLRYVHRIKHPDV